MAASERTEITLAFRVVGKRIVDMCERKTHNCTMSSDQVFWKRKAKAVEPPLCFTLLGDNLSLGAAWCKHAPWLEKWDI